MTNHYIVPVFDPIDQNTELAELFVRDVLENIFEQRTTDEEVRTVAKKVLAAINAVRKEP